MISPSQLQHRGAETAALLTILAWIPFEHAVAEDELAAVISGSTAVVGTPDGFAHDDAWRSGWLYASLVLIHAKDTSLYETLKSDEGLDIELVKKYLEYFRDNCLSDEGWLRAGSLNDNFS